MKKNFIVFFLMLLIGMFAYSQGNNSETIFGIKMGADYTTVDSILRSKGFYLENHIEKQNSYLYKGGSFAETKPDGIIITISDANKLTTINVFWESYYYLKNGGMEDKVILGLGANKNYLKMGERICQKNNDCFSTLVRSLNKKYGANIVLPDTFQQFLFPVYMDEKIGIAYGFDFDGYDIQNASYYLSFQSKSYEAPTSDDL